MSKPAECKAQSWQRISQDQFQQVEATRWVVDFK